MITVLRSCLLAAVLFTNACQSLNIKPETSTMMKPLPPYSLVDPGLQLAASWQADLLAQYYRITIPDMITMSPDEKQLYIACETSSGKHHPSLLRMDISTGNYVVLLDGLQRADGLKMAPDGSLWLGEETSDGMIWQIRHPASLPAGQHIDRQKRVATHHDITPLMIAGQFSHEGFEFSADHKFCYLADEWKYGSLYRLRLSNQQLSVMHQTKGWSPITHPLKARAQSKRRDGAVFLRIEDMERLPSGEILLAETGVGDHSGRILVLNDNVKPRVSTYLQDARIKHPDNLEWDRKRRWLWITDDVMPSKLWAWDGKNLHLIATHPSAEITGVTASRDGSVFINLQGKHSTPGATIRLRQP